MKESSQKYCKIREKDEGDFTICGMNILKE